MVMRHPKKGNEASPIAANRHRRTSIGMSVNTRPKNKSKKRDFKPYRGQGR